MTEVQPAGNSMKKKVFTGIGIVVGVLVLFVLYSAFRGFTQQSLGLSGTVSTFGAPALMAPMYDKADNYAFRGDAEVAMKRQAAADMAYAPGAYPMDGVSEMEMMPAPLPTGGDVPMGNALIIKNADLALLVADINVTVGEIDKLRVLLGGQPGNANFSEYGYGKSGDITFSVPSEKFDFALAEVKKLALKVTNERISVSDVSAQFVDLQARLKNLRATEAQYVEIMKRSGTINEVLSVTRELTQTRAQIEQLQGQLNYLSRQVALSSIHVSLAQEVRPGEVKDEWRPLSVVKAATKETLKDFTRFIDMLLIMLVMLPMFLLRIAFYGIILWLVWHFGRIIYRRLKSAYLPPPVK